MGKLRPPADSVKDHFSTPRSRSRGHVERLGREVVDFLEHTFSNDAFFFTIVARVAACPYCTNDQRSSP